MYSELKTTCIFYAKLRKLVMGVVPMGFNSIEEKVIFDYLSAGVVVNSLPDKSLGNLPEQEKQENKSLFQISAEISEDIKVLDYARTNTSYRNIISIRRGARLIIFIKKIVRKLVFWYVEPVCQQQTTFNNSVTPAIGRLNEISFALIKQTDENKHQTANQFQDFSNKTDEQFQNLANKIDCQLSTLDKLNNKLAKEEENSNYFHQSQQTMNQQLLNRCNELESLIHEISKTFLDKQNKIIEDNFKLHEKNANFHEENAKLQEENIKLQLQQHEELEKTISAIKVVQDSFKEDVHAKESQVNHRINEEITIRTAIQHDFENNVKSLSERFLNAERKMEQLEAYEIFKHPIYEKRSFSQTGEDMILSIVFNLLKIPTHQIFYLDLGANHAKEISNTYYFYRLGARGVLVEANPTLATELKIFRNGDTVLNKCITNKSGDFIDFYVLNGDGLSTSVKENVEEFLRLNPTLYTERVVQVETITIMDVIKSYFQTPPTLLNIDIEGKEEEIINSIDFTLCRPIVIICEMIPYVPDTLVTGQKNRTISEIMQRNNYVEYAFTGINSIFIDRDKLYS